MDFFKRKLSRASQSWQKNINTFDNLFKLIIVRIPVWIHDVDKWQEEFRGQAVCWVEMSRLHSFCERPRRRWVQQMSAASPSPPCALTQTGSRPGASIRVETSSNHSTFSATAQSSKLAVVANCSRPSQLIYWRIPPLSMWLLLARFSFPLWFTHFASVWPQWSLFQSRALWSGRAVLTAALQNSKSLILEVTAARNVGFFRLCQIKSYIRAYFSFYCQSEQTFVL